MEIILDSIYYISITTENQTKILRYNGNLKKNNIL